MFFYLDPTAVHGSCGLWNIGNTCFMNAGIQSLASCAPLLKFLFEQFQYRQGMQGTLTGAFYVLLCKLWSGQYSVIYPLHFKELLGLYHPQFRDYRQVIIVVKSYIHFVIRLQYFTYIQIFFLFACSCFFTV